MWFFKGFAQGIGAFIVTILVVAVIGFVLWLPMFACKEIFGEYGILIGWIFEMIMAFGLLGARIAYVARSE